MTLKRKEAGNTVFSGTIRHIAEHSEGPVCSILPAERSETGTQFPHIHAKGLGNKFMINGLKNKFKGLKKNAEVSEINLKVLEINSKVSEINSKVSKINLKVLEINLKISETNSKVSEIYSAYHLKVIKIGFFKKIEFSQKSVEYHFRRAFFKRF